MMLNPILCDYSDAYIRLKGTVTVPNTTVKSAAGRPNNRRKQLTFMNRALFTYFISKINNALVDNAKDIDVVMWMYNLIEYNNNYSKISSSLTFWLIKIIVLRLNLKRNNRQNRHWWNKRCWNNGANKISK